MSRLEDIREELAIALGEREVDWTQFVGSLDLVTTLAFIDMALALERLADMAEAARYSGTKFGIGGGR